MRNKSNTLQQFCAITKTFTGRLSSGFFITHWLLIIRQNEFESLLRQKTSFTISPLKQRIDIIKNTFKNKDDNTGNFKWGFYKKY